MQLEQMPFHQLRFCEREKRERENFLSRIEAAQTATEAARVFLETAQSARGSTARERELLEYAEAIEATARREFAKWERRDRIAAQHAHELESLLVRLVCASPKAKKKTRIPARAATASATDSVGLRGIKNEPLGA